MKAHKLEVDMKENNQETRVALLEQSIIHINESLSRIEKRFDSIDKKFDSIEKEMKDGFKYLNDKMDSRFIWTVTFFIGGYASLFAMIAHVARWF